MIENERYSTLQIEIIRHELQHKITLLKLFSCFSGIKQTRLPDIAETMHRKSYKHGQVVFREGDSSREVYFIIRGDFAVSAYVSVKADDEQKVDQENTSPNFLEKDAPTIKVEVIYSNFLVIKKILYILGFSTSTR